MSWMESASAPPAVSILRERRRSVDLEEAYARREPLAALVLYDRAGARLLHDAAIDIAVASYSAGPPHGIPDERTATVADSVAATAAIRGENTVSFLTSDIPFICYQSSGHDFVAIARALMRAGADAIKVEGGATAEGTIRRLRAADIPVVGHIGYTPKTGMKLRRRGQDEADAATLLSDAVCLQAAGVSALVLECVDPCAAARITEALDIPTLGLYSGAETSGQVLVLNDILDRTRFDGPAFPRGRPASIGVWTGEPAERVRAFARKVKERQFPAQTAAPPSRTLSRASTPRFPAQTAAPPSRTLS